MNISFRPTELTASYIESLGVIFLCGYYDITMLDEMKRLITTSLKVGCVLSSYHFLAVLLQLTENHV